MLKNARLDYDAYKKWYEEDAKFAGGRYRIPFLESCIVDDSEIMEGSDDIVVRAIFPGMGYGAYVPLRFLTIEESRQIK